MSAALARGTRAVPRRLAEPVEAAVSGHAVGAPRCDSRPFPFPLYIRERERSAFALTNCACSGRAVSSRPRRSRVFRPLLPRVARCEGPVGGRFGWPPRILCGRRRLIVIHQQILIFRPPVIVIGERKVSSRPQPSQRSSPRRNPSTSDKGSVTISMTGKRRAQASFQNTVCGMRSRQKTCHRAMVRRSAPTSFDNSWTRRGVGPCCMAAIRTTTAERYTLRPRKRTDGGVILFRHPSRSQQKLKRYWYCSGRSSGQPRGDRG